MTTEKKCVVAEQVCEVIIGAGVGAVLNNHLAKNDYNAINKVAITLAAGIFTWSATRGFAKKFFKFCDDMFDTEFGDLTDKL